MQPFDRAYVESFRAGRHLEQPQPVESFRSPKGGNGNNCSGTFPGTSGNEWERVTYGFIRCRPESSPGPLLKFASRRLSPYSRHRSGWRPDRRTSDSTRSIPQKTIAGGW